MMTKSISIFALCAMVLISCKKDEVDEPTNSTPQGDPTAVQLSTVILTGFDEINPGGSYWDGGDGSNLPDPFIEVYKDDVLVFKSEVTPSASPSGTYNMSTADLGSLPINFIEGSELLIKLYDHDGDPATNAPDFIGQVVLADALNFLYGGDNAADYNDQLVAGSGGTTFLLSGDFIY